MKMIAELVEDIREELNDAEEYAKKAIQYKQEFPRVAENYANTASQELSHMENFHTQAVKLIQDQRATGAEVPAGMQAVWDWEHSHMMDHVARIKTLLSLYQK